MHVAIIEPGDDRDADLDEAAAHGRGAAARGGRAVRRSGSQQFRALAAERVVGARRAGRRGREGGRARADRAKPKTRYLVGPDAKRRPRADAPDRLRDRCSRVSSSAHEGSICRRFGCELQRWRSSGGAGRSSGLVAPRRRDRGLVVAPRRRSCRSAALVERDLVSDRRVLRAAVARFGVLAGARARPRGPSRYLRLGSRHGYRSPRGSARATGFARSASRSASPRSASTRSSSRPATKGRTTTTTPGRALLRPPRHRDVLVRRRRARGRARAASSTSSRRRTRMISNRTDDDLVAPHRRRQGRLRRARRPARRARTTSRSACMKELQR